MSKWYGERRVLRDVSIRLAAGEGMALLGPNGSGKTTLLCLLAGVLRADHGSALCGGVCTSHKRARRGVGFVPQSGAVYDDLSALENVALFGRLHGLRGPTLRTSVEASLRQTELWDQRDARANTYSGGMRRRLSLACALVHAPAVLLLDEPFEGVDEDSRAHLLEVLSDSKRRGVALLLSTHRLEEVAALCEQFTLLRDGAVVATRAVPESDADSPYP
ncbi:MAG TPA: ABC transporter ATP-binding protein [Polyangiales bacterium]|nr:ABC transporter ATP-binding protein [Polyangiales bacterium]